jgi:hypothetical protein
MRAPAPGRGRRSGGGRRTPLTGALDPIAYHNPEAYLFPELARLFAETGQLDSEALYLILDWKAPRARTRHLVRLRAIAGTFDAAAQGIAADLVAATGAEQQMTVLMAKWGFRLPTASAILAVLYPDTFTVYDVRVCDALDDFRELGDLKSSPAMWREYQRFVEAVRANTPAALPSLRDRDRWLWGQSKRRKMAAELAGLTTTPQS